MHRKWKWQTILNISFGIGIALTLILNAAGIYDVDRVKDSLTPPTYRSIPQEVIVYDKDYIKLKCFEEFPCWGQQIVLHSSERYGPNHSWSYSGLTTAVALQTNRGYFAVPVPSSYNDVDEFLILTNEGDPFAIVRGEEWVRAGDFKE